MRVITINWDPPSVHIFWQMPHYDSSLQMVLHHSGHSVALPATRRQAGLWKVWDRIVLKQVWQKQILGPGRVEVKFNPDSLARGQVHLDRDSISPVPWSPGQCVHLKDTAGTWRSSWQEGQASPWEDADGLQTRPFLREQKDEVLTPRRLHSDDKERAGQRMHPRVLDNTGLLSAYHPLPQTVS